MYKMRRRAAYFLAVLAATFFLGAVFFATALAGVSKVRLRATHQRGPSWSRRSSSPRASWPEPS